VQGLPLCVGIFEVFRIERDEHAPLVGKQLGRLRVLALDFVECGEDSGENIASLWRVSGLYAVDERWTAICSHRELDDRCAKVPAPVPDS